MAVAVTSRKVDAMEFVSSFRDRSCPSFGWRCTGHPFDNIVSLSPTLHHSLSSICFRSQSEHCDEMFTRSLVRYSFEPIAQRKFDEILWPICRGKKGLGMLVTVNTSSKSAHDMLTDRFRTCNQRRSGLHGPCYPMQASTQIQNTPYDCVHRGSSSST